MGAISFDYPATHASPDLICFDAPFPTNDASQDLFTFSGYLFSDFLRAGCLANMGEATRDLTCVRDSPGQRNGAETNVFYEQIGPILFLAASSVMIPFYL